MFQTVFHCAHELLANHRTHGAAQETKLESTGDDIEPRELARHHDERVAFAGLFLRLHEAIAVTLRILEFQRIFGFDLGGNFLVRAGIQEFQQPLPAADAHVMAAFGADVEVALDLRAVEHGIARRTLGPKPFGHRARTALGLDTRRDDSLKPGHAVVYQKPPEGAGMP